MFIFYVTIQLGCRQNLVIFNDFRRLWVSYALDRQSKADTLSFCQLYLSVYMTMLGMPPLESRGGRPLKMTFEDQLKSLIFFHLEEKTSA